MFGYRYNAALSSGGDYTASYQTATNRVEGVYPSTFFITGVKNESYTSFRG
jgi:hypothetical protein